MAEQRVNGAKLAWGVCKWYSEAKGYGWITLPGGECDVFVHAKQLLDSNIHRPLQQGEEVGCEVRKAAKGWYATNIHVNTF